MRKFGICLCAMISVLTVLGTPLLAHAVPPDNTPPVIGTPVFTPSSPSATNPVTVRVNVTDDRSVNNVTIVYSTDNWRATNTTLLATYNATTTTAAALIPALSTGGHALFYIVAFDTAGNKAVNNNSGSYFGYNVPAPPVPTTTSTWLVYGVIGAVFAGVAVAALKMLLKGKQPSPQTHYSSQ